MICNFYLPVPAFNLSNLFLIMSFTRSETRFSLVVLLSLILHLAGLWVFLGGDTFEYGVVKRIQQDGPTALEFSVHLVVNKNSFSQTVLAINESPTSAEVSKINDTKIEASPSSVRNQNDDSHHNYYDPGRLTRLPFPLAEIDLNEAAIDEVAIEGSIELTVSVNEDGTVANVSTANKNENVRRFVDRISTRFLTVRFSPGEIDGKAVKAQFKIEVVSEVLPTPSPHS